MIFPLSFGSPAESHAIPVDLPLSPQEVKINVVSDVLSNLFQVVRVSGDAGKWIIYFVSTPSGNKWRNYVITVTIMVCERMS